MLRDYRILSRYSFALASSVLIVVAAWQFSPLVGKPIIFLLALLLVTVNVLIGSLMQALFVVGIASVTFLYFFIVFFRSHFPLSVVTFFEVLLFAVTGAIIGYCIEKYKQTNIIDEFTTKEREFLTRISAIEMEKLAMEKEIKLRDEFLSIASHELKTPLTSMLLKIQLALHNVRNVSLANFSVENLLKMLETAEGQTKRLSKMINDLLNVSLITTGKLNLEVEKADLIAIIKEVITEFAERLDAAKIQLTYSGEEQLHMHIDKLRIAQVITNLLSNAIKYGDGKPITIRVTKNHTSVTIVIQDQGIGIAAHQHEKIFALFERGVDPNTYKGLGVGLYIANQIIRAHGGEIKLESKPNNGATFVINLPFTNST